MATPQSTSPMGLGFLERHEGVVLRAYRCPAGIWTIGAGLTRASGVIDPKPGMVITAAQAQRALQVALSRNYEPAVQAAMPGANQHEFDGGVSFHFNTGAIGRAGWVNEWRSPRRWEVIARRLAEWRKGGGKVLPGLVARRAAELRLMQSGVYGAAPAQPQTRGTRHAIILFELPPEQIAEIRKALKSLGHDPGPDPLEISMEAVRAFQKAHGLTVDGILGRATLSTLQRRLDAPHRAVAPAATGAVGATTEVAADPLTQGLPDWAGVIVIAVGAIWLAKVAWDYRDAVAAKIDRKLPRIAAWLRSV
jgi:lysozyme